MAERWGALSAVLCIGEAMVQVSPTAGQGIAAGTMFQLVVGGAESNVASLVAQLGHQATWLGAVGDDPFGRIVTSSLEAVGVDVSKVTSDGSHKTGVYFKDVKEGTTTVHYYRESSAASRMGPSSLADVAEAPWDVVHLSGITPALSATCDQLVHSVIVNRSLGNATVSFDVNYRSALWSREAASGPLRTYANGADIVFVGLDEAKTLWGLRDAHAIREFLPAPRFVIVKDADIDATEFDGHRASSVPAMSVHVVENVGAGDAFAAGWLCGYLASRTSSERLRLGHLMASEALKTRTDSVLLPSGTSVIALLAGSQQP